MQKLFPNTILLAIGLLISGLVLATPVIFLTGNQYFSLSDDLKNTLLYFVFSVLVLGIAYLMNRKRKTELTFNFKVSFVLPVTLLIACVCFFQIGLNVPAGKLLSMNFGSSGSTVKNPFDQLVLVLGSLILGPVFEEIIYRGIILKGLLASNSPKLAIIASSIIFAVSHGKPIQILGALILGLFLGWIYYKTKSLGLTILLHFTANLSGHLAAYINYKYATLAGVKTFLIYGNFTYYIITVSWVLLGICIYYLYQKIKQVNL